MLQLENIHYNIDTRRAGAEILAGIDFSLEAGSLTVITGPNGSGKSTLAKIIMGILAPTQGRVLFEGQDITALDISQRAKLGIGFAFQQPVRFKGLTVQDLLSLAAARPLSKDEACTYLSEVGMCALDYVQREINASLSGGELKRIEIAMLLARGCRLALFDEPEAGIDLWSFHNLIRVFQNMREKFGGAIVIISHQERILEIADRIILLGNGRIAQTGSKDVILPALLASSDTCKYYKEAY